ncbi:hypothetical protein RhiirA5_505168 [Rhizophagus irregularis]|uniref:Uncharacterized protein n=1 Tax=Rhizophagus irregularis TaxID=588596 RepID=A0A2N0P0Y9_9GLOM|nr:hypothetical protein RhiirA5_505168 [Rhizophagus irregularis]
MTDLPVQEFYRIYTSYCETHCISPLSKINASRILSNELGINSKKIRVGKATPRVYSISREDLYKKYFGKNWILETDEIDIEGIEIETSKKPASDPKALEKFLANIYNPSNNPQDIQEKPAKKKLEHVIKEQPVSKRAPPPLPPKPDHLKERLQELREEQPDPDDYDVLDDLLSNLDSTTADPVPEKLSAPEPDDYDVLDDLLSDSDFTTVDPVLEQQPESPAKSSTKSESLADSKSSTEPNSKELWAKYQDASDEYNWEILAFGVEECPTTRIEDKYQYYLREVVNRFKDLIEYNGNLSKTSSRKELANIIRIYKENCDAKIIFTSSGYETMRANKGKAREILEEYPKTDIERQ